MGRPYRLYPRRGSCLHLCTIYLQFEKMVSWSRDIDAGLWCSRSQVQIVVGQPVTGKLSVQQQMFSFFKSGIEKRVKGEGWTLPFLCAAQGGSLTSLSLQSVGSRKPFPLPFYLGSQKWWIVFINHHKMLDPVIGFKPCLTWRSSQS